MFIYCAFINEIYTVTRVSYIESLFFLLTAAGAARGWVLLIIGFGVWCGFVRAVWSSFFDAISPLFFWIWTGLNFVCAAAVTAAVLRQVRLTKSWRSWLALGACIMGIGLWMQQVSEARTACNLQPPELCKFRPVLTPSTLVFAPRRARAGSCPRAAVASAPAPKHNDKRAEQPVATENRRLPHLTYPTTIKLARFKRLSFRN